MQAKITLDLVKTLPAADKEYLVHDTSLKGFALRVMPSGTKTYVIRYRMGGRDTPKQKVTIGKHGSPWTPAQARAEAERLLGLVAHGIDPIAQAKAETAAAFTMGELADRYLTEHVAVRNKPSSAREFRRLVATIVKPQLGTRPVATLTRADIAALHYRLRETPRSANQVLAVLSKMLSLAELWGLRPDGSNPCGKVQRYPEKSRERFLSDAEMTRLGTVLAEMADTRQEDDVCLACIRLLLLTGCRLGEVLALAWEDVELEAGFLRIRDAKAGARSHHIGEHVETFLKDLPRPGPWVLPSVRTPKEPLPESTIQHAWMRIRAKAGLDDVRLHDLRHTVGTYAGQTGANAFLVRDALGHKTLAMTGRYVNRDANPLRVLSDAIGGRITAALDAGKAEADRE